LGSGQVLNLDDPDVILQASKRNAQHGPSSEAATQDYLKQLKEHRERLKEEAWASLKKKDFKNALSIKHTQELLDAQIEEEQRKEDLVKDVEDSLRKETLERKEREAAAKGEIVLLSVKEDSLSVLRNELSELRFGTKIAPEKQITRLRADILKLEQEIEDAKTRKEIEMFYGTHSNQQTAIDNGAEVESFLAGVSHARLLDVEPTPPLADLENFASWQEAQEALHKGPQKVKTNGSVRPRPVSIAMFCDGCGSVFPAPSAKFCAECGAKRSMAADPSHRNHDEMSPAQQWAFSARSTPAHQREERPNRKQQNRVKGFKQKQLQQRISELMDDLELVEDSLLDLADTCGSEKMAMEEREQTLKTELVENQRALKQLGEIDDDEDEKVDEASDVD